MSAFSDAIDNARKHYADAAQRDGGDLTSLRERAAATSGVRSLTEILSEDRLCLIVEPKPRNEDGRGDIADIVRECEAAGACAVSVIVEDVVSGGDPADLRRARAACSLPLLARDFIVDVRQVYELRACGADALLIPAVAHLGRTIPDDEMHLHVDRTDTLTAIVGAAHELGMEVVLSVRTDEELELAVRSDADALNVDNRHKDGTIDAERTLDLLADVPVGWPVISESIASAAQVAQLHRAGVDALLLDEGHTESGLTAALAVFADLTLDA
jgi:indole-3-glycerol phosphate synthase